MNIDMSIFPRLIYQQAINLSYAIQHIRLFISYTYISRGI